jgi:hypothetical protein
VAFFLVVFENGTSRDLFSTIAIPSALFGGRFDVLVHALFFLANSFDWFLLGHRVVPFYLRNRVQRTLPISSSLTATDKHDASAQKDYLALKAEACFGSAPAKHISQQLHFSTIARFFASLLSIPDN